MIYKMGGCAFEAESPYLTLDLTDSSSIKNDPEALHARLEEDGYLLLRGLHDPEAVLKARREILARLDERGQIDHNFPLDDAVAAPEASEKATSSVRGNEDLKTPALLELLQGEPILDFFGGFFGSPAITFNFQWLRAAAPGAGSPIHADLPYMGRGTRDLCTLWTPLGHTTPDMGPLALCLGSHKWKKVRETYTASDVDRDHTPGVFTTAPDELVDKFGGRWATTTFEPGDAVIVNMFLLHGSLTNQSNRIRLSCDTRFQRADAPIDERWAGPTPTGHPTLWGTNPKLEPIAVSRERWGV
jgi:ectoine hydroxylase-related dioxygenase (phytanoyl-CoA dioxygenase family)